MTTTASTTVPALDVVGLRKTYGSGPGAVTALRGLDLAFPTGSFTAVMGPSGSGKSTFLACAAGLERPDAGRVRITGEDVTDVGETHRTRLRRDRLGFVFQEFHLLPYLTAEQNVALPLRLAGRRVDRTEVRDVLARVGLDDRCGHLPGALSGGQQQRVALARALVTRPAVLLADEPTGALDSTTARSVLDLVRHAVDELGQTVVMVTHDPVAAARADAVAFLVDGQVADRITAPSPEAVAGRLAHLDELGATGVAV